MPESKCVVIDDDDTDSCKAIEHVREVAANDPELAARGFTIFVTDERGQVLFKVACGLDKPAATLH